MLFNIPARRVAEGADVSAFAERRVYKGSGESYLIVPGLKELYGVNVDGVDLPVEMRMTIPMDLDGKKLVERTMPGAVIVEHEELGTILVRNVCSNDGVWAKVSTITLAGVWSDEYAELTSEVLDTAADTSMFQVPVPTQESKPAEQPKQQAPAPKKAPFGGGRKKKGQPIGVGAK